MPSFSEYMAEYQLQLQKGLIQKAYRGLMDYMMALRTHLAGKYPDYAVSGSLYCGYMDMTYFSFTPPDLQERRLKTAIVFLHQPCRFEVWLAGVNKGVQAEYWQLFRTSGWNQYRIVPAIRGADAILEHTLVDAPDFADLEGLTAQIERAALQFSRDVEAFLAGHD